MRKFINFLKLLPVVCILGIHLLGFFPQVHPLFDTLGNWRLVTTPILFFMALNLLLSGRGLWMLITALSAIIGLFSFGFEFPALTPPKGNFRLVQIELDPGRANETKLITWLNATKPDVISMRTNSRAEKDLTLILKSEYPEHLVCPGGFQKQVVLMSRWPFNASQCSYINGLGWADLNVAGKQLQIATVALDYPYPEKQWQQLKDLEQDFRKLKPSLIVAAHLNSMPWSHGAAQIAKFSGTHPISGPVFTLQIAQIPVLPVMQIFASSETVISNVQVGDDFGSMHLPVIADFKF